MTDTATPTAPAPGTPEYDAAMISKAEGNVVFPEAGLTGEKKPAESPAPEARPTAEPPKKILDKFDSVDDLAKAYTELQKKLGERAPEAKPADPNAAPPSLDALIAKAGDEFSAGGNITVETYEALAKAGISKDRVDAYVEGVVARAELQRSKVFSEAGGEDKYTAMTEWAKANLTPEQIEAFNDAVTGGNLAKTIGAVRNLKAIYDAANGTAPNRRLTPDGSSDSAVANPHFKSDAELTKAMADPRYRTDPAYRAEVERQLAESDRLGIQVGARLIVGRQKS